MSEDTKSSAAIGSESPEASSRGATVPVWLFILLFLLFYWGAAYFDESGGWFSPGVYTPYASLTELQKYQPRREGPDLARGQAKFEQTCGLCHGVDGAGKPGQAPPLAGSEIVTAEGVNRLVRIPVLGLTGPIEVKGQQYTFAAGMTPLAPNSMRSAFTDEDLAAVLSYIRQAWGNKAGPVTEAQVKAIRDDIGNRSQSLTVPELLSLPEKH
jgi:mono/diheme cytochrome c family protein